MSLSHSPEGQVVVEFPYKAGKAHEIHDLLEGVRERLTDLGISCISSTEEHLTIVMSSELEPVTALSRLSATIQGLLAGNTEEPSKKEALPEEASPLSHKDTIVYMPGAGSQMQMTSGSDAVGLY